MHAFRPILLRFMFWILLPLLLFFGVGYFYLRQSLPDWSETRVIAAITKPVKLVRDADGVPHIFAETDQDAFFSLGYVHAQDRLFQMEMMRRSGSGRTAEVLGTAAQFGDQMMLCIGLRKAAEKAWESLDEDAKNALEAYATGVNAVISSDQLLPPEFLLLDFEPEPWGVVDSLVVSKMIGLDLSRNFRWDLMRLMVTQDLGSEVASMLLPAYPEDGPVTVSSLELSELNRATDIGDLSDILRPKRAVGSNAWVISGKLTESGRPLLANDPHLETTAPAAWYLAEINGDRLHVSGATIPGLPYVLFGHNQNIAWGGSNMMADTQDIWLERFDPNSYDSYEVNGEMVKLDVQEASIAIKKSFPSILHKTEDTVFFKVRTTRHGPVLSDAPRFSAASSRIGSAFSLRWTGLDDIDGSVGSMLRLNYATDWASFNEAFHDYVAPAMNFVYADTQGNIGYLGAGKIPVRASGTGMIPSPGWNDDHEWLGYVPFEEMPRSYNPEKGYIVNANNRVVDQDYPHHLTNDWDYPYRAARISQLIEQGGSSGKGLSVQDMVTMQGDLLSLEVLETLPLLLRLEPLDDRQKEALDILSKWDGVTSADSVATTIYQSWVFQMGQALLLDELKEPVRFLVFENFPGYLQEVAGEGEHFTCDNRNTPQVETCDDTLRAALNRALVDLQGLIGSSDMEDWKWSEVHSREYAHAPMSSGNPLLKKLFHRKGVTGGDRYTINAAPPTSSPHHRFESFFGSSLRQVMDLNDFNASLYINSPGQSGNPISSHYDDLIDRFSDLNYLPMTSGINKVNGTVSTLQPKQ